MKCTYRQTALSVVPQLESKGDTRSRAVLLIVFKIPKCNLTLGIGLGGGEQLSSDVDRPVRDNRKRAPCYMTGGTALQSRSHGAQENRSRQGAGAGRLYIHQQPLQGAAYLWRCYNRVTLGTYYNVFKL